MISLIICSVNPVYLANISQNIKNTIGVDYELLAFDNRNKALSICSVYNFAATNAKYEYLCFIHEDVQLHTTNWGGIITNLLSDNSVSLVGVSGAVYKSDTPCSWVDCDKKHYRLSTLQHQHNTNVAFLVNLNPRKEFVSEVAVIDGVFMATRKEIWRHHNFDEKLLQGFHGYDFDFSMSVGESGKVLVTHDLLLEHYSPGSFSQEWVQDTIALHRKWAHVLPRNVDFKGKHDRYSDYIAHVSILAHLLKHDGYNKSVLYFYSRLVFNYFRFNRFRFSKSIIKYLFFNSTNISI